MPFSGQGRQLGREESLEPLPEQSDAQATDTQPKSIFAARWALPGGSSAAAAAGAAGAPYNPVQQIGAERRDTTADLLARLPDTVIHHGRVIPVRAGIEQFIKVRVSVAV